MHTYRWILINIIHRRFSGTERKNATGFYNFNTKITEGHTYIAYLSD